MISVHARRLVAGSMDRPIEVRRRYHLAPDGLSVREIRVLQSESDFASTCESRLSFDGGSTFTDWQDDFASFYENNNGTETLIHNCLICEFFNPVQQHYVGAYMERVYPGGRRKCFDAYFAGSNMPYTERVVLTLRKPGATEYTKQYIDFDIDHSNAYFGTNIEVLTCGDILVPLGPNVRTCCRIAGLDVDTVFPSSPDIMRGVIIARGRWNAEKAGYEFSFSKPIVAPDVFTSRGLDEPTVAELESGRIIVVCRGSNVVNPAWHTRISRTAVGYKWFTFSDDGGKTFAPIMPWHMDTRESVYSSATISQFFRIPGKGMYWVGNITDPAITSGNFPRFPLLIARIDETDGTLIKDSITVIDTKRTDEPVGVQLSNFYGYVDKDELDITLTKFCQYSEQAAFHGDTWNYRIAFE